MKKYIVTLTDDERKELGRMVASGKGAARKLMHARILLKADSSEGGPGWKDAKIAEALEAGTATIERVRRQFVEEPLEAALTRRRPRREYQRKLDGDGEAHRIAVACSQAPEGRKRWTLRLLADRAFESFVHLALLLAAGLHAIFPAHPKRPIDFRCKHRQRNRNKRKSVRARTASRNRPTYDREVVRRCGSRDPVVRWHRPMAKPRRMTQKAFEALPETIQVRELRRLVRFPDGPKPEITLITTLTDEKRYPPEERVRVLKGRWQVEVNLRHLKTTMKMNVLRSQTVEGLKRE